MAIEINDTTNSAGFPPAPPEAHQRADFQNQEGGYEMAYDPKLSEAGFCDLLQEIKKRLSDPETEGLLTAKGEDVLRAAMEIKWAIREYWKEIEIALAMEGK